MDEVAASQQARGLLLQARGTAVSAGVDVHLFAGRLRAVASFLRDGPGKASYTGT